MRYKLIILFVIYSVFTQAQATLGFPPTETFIKYSYTNAFQTPNIHFASAELTYYINSFGNTTDCGKDDSEQEDKKSPNIFACLLINMITTISAFELDAGLETTIYDHKLYVIPKAGFFLRPLYYGKAGFSVSTIGVNIYAGASFPIKAYYLVEILYQSNLTNFNKSPYLESDVSGLRIGVQIPVYLPTKKSKSKNKKLF